MMYDMDYAIYQYINAQAEQYVEFDDLLKQNHCTMEEAQQEIKAFREKYHSLLAGYAFSDCDLAAACEELMAQMEQHPGSPDLQYLYLCIVTDFGLLWNAGVQERSAEQEVRNYFRQRERMQELTAFLQVQDESMRKYENLLEHLKKPIEGNQAEYAEESDFLYHLTIQHIFLHDGIKNEIFETVCNFCRPCEKNGHDAKAKAFYAQSECGIAVPGLSDLERQRQEFQPLSVGAGAL